MQIKWLILINYMFKAFVLILTILLFAYIVGVLFYIYCDLTNDNEESETSDFIESFEVYNLAATHRTI